MLGLGRMIIHDWERPEYKKLVQEVGFSVDRSALIPVHSPFLQGGHCVQEKHGPPQARLNNYSQLILYFSRNIAP
jgi:hypothetical protein